MIALNRADLVSLALCAAIRAEDLAIQILNEQYAGRDPSRLVAAADEAQRVAAKVRAVLEMGREPA